MVYVFYALSQNASKGEEIDTGQLLQLSSQLPAVTVSNEVLSDIDDLQRNIPISPTAQSEDIQPMPTASVFILSQTISFQQQTSVVMTSFIPCQLYRSLMICR